MLTQFDKYIYTGFDIHTVGDIPGGYWESEEDCCRFHSELEKKFAAAGWEVSGCDVKRGKSYLYIHPTRILGAVKENEIEEVCLLLQSAETCRLWGFEKIQEQYDMTLAQAEEYLWRKQDEIEIDIARELKTTARKFFKHPDYWFFKGYGEFVMSYCMPLDNRIAGAAGQKVIPAILESMAERKILVRAEINGKLCYRTKFKTEKI
jgi:hypothetical protein